MTQIASYLATKLYEEKLPVTYRMLSRELSIDVRRSKEELAEFYKKNEKLEVMYIVSGLKNGLAIKLASKQDLETVKQGYEKVLSVACYSLSTSGVGAQEVANMEGMRRNEWLSPELQRKLGIIEGPSDEEQPAEQIEQAEEQRPKVDVVEKSAPKRSPEPKSAQSPKPTKKTENIPAITSKYVSRKLENSKSSSSLQKTLPASKAKPKSKAAFTYVSRKEPKESIVAGDIEDDNSFPLNEPPRKKTTEEINKERQELAAMFTDSDDEMQDTQVIEEDSAPSKEDSLFVIDDDEDEGGDQSHAKEDASPTDQMDVDLASDFDTSIQEINPPVASNEPPQNKVEQPKEEITSYVDEDGFITTVRNTKISTDKPSNSKSSSSKPSPTVGTVKGKSSKKAQSTLMSFFGKK
ncbi:BA75_00928T0 [Komagataella pastoris]|uniref:DNA polymerase delta subunit 3 n=1 Tax=Komagataella pastoris TaxID=4922 RepID=A0A1B2J7G9_PICPA|nr:BA75_00928T0 [Komagataella pastoris]